MNALLRSLWFTAAAVASLPGLAREPLFVPALARLSPNAPITEAARAECQIPSIVATHVLQELTERMGPAVRSFEGVEPASGKVLRLTVHSAHGIGGGSWTGPKSMTVRAELVEGGAVIAGWSARRSSRGGLVGGMSGTCAIFDRVAAAIGEDIGNWTMLALRRAADAQAAAPEAAAEAPASPASEPVPR
jgi:hypothetical protein